jgi:diaminohydroxyphosphoribosylaminopyrimidine deaminase/5-amino-6-(5-phosphoribosylamino)uracil reductase
VTGPDDSYWMRRALAEAERGRGAVEPNPLVGAVVVQDGRLVGSGYHRRFGGPHAEVEALEAAGERGRGGTLYVTLEPCCHQGKTPPCTEALIRAGVREVVAAMRDPFPLVQGGGFARLREAGIVVRQGVEEEAARRLNAPYLKRLATGRPYVTAKWAMTLDGKTACRSGDSRWISGERSRAAVHALRGRMDAILVGIGTVLADDPRLTARPPGPRTAARVVLDRQARLPLESRLAGTAREVPVLVYVSSPESDPARLAALRAAGCEVVALPGSGQPPIPAVLDDLGRRGMTNLLVEGGGRVLGSFLDAGEVDAVEVFLAPILAGGPPRYVPAQGEGAARISDALRLDRQEVAVLDGDVHLRGTIDRPWRRLLNLGPP